MDAEFLHDLRLPLQLIQSGAQMARLALGDPGLDPAEYLDLVSENAAQLRRMLEGAMSESRGTPRQVDAAGCLRSLCRRCSAYGRERGVSLSFQTNVDALPLRLDEDKLSRAALNLMMNALRFAPVGSRVSVELRATGDFVEITVEDDGPGVAPERLPYIFMRGETTGGSGYGLPAAMECARALGGSITAAPGKMGGMKFTLRLPMGEARQAMSCG